MDGSENNRDIIEFFEELLKQDTLNGALEGIAKQLITKGENSLSHRQLEVVEKFVQNYEQNHECPRCGNGNVTSLMDLIFISENGLCPMCDYDREKFMKD